jgi:hypothetical protein
LQHCLNDFSPVFLAKYKWGVNRAGRLPCAYVFPKGKKQYRKGRPIISFAGTTCEKLWKGVAAVLGNLTRIAFPNVFHRGSLPIMYKHLHTFLSSATEDLACHNDDLVGFFTSVPCDRIVQACQITLDLYLRAHPPPRTTAEVRFTVMTNEQDTKFKVFRGKKRMGSVRTNEIWLDDIIELVQLSFTSSDFTVCDRVYRQTRGSCIGSHISPALCNMVAAVEERCWELTFHIYQMSPILSGLHNNLFVLRYVDNRLTIFPTRFQNQAYIKSLLDLEFYKPPVILEEVGDFHILGFNLCVKDKTMTYMLPTKPWQIKSPHSANSLVRNASGFHSRAALIKQGTFPPEDSDAQVEALVELYISKGFPRGALTKH